MQMPLFFTPEILGARQIMLDEDTSKHIIGVLRMKVGNSFLLTDGKGNKAKAEIVEENRKKCVVQILSMEVEEPTSNVSIAISLIKNASRFEWFLEKATEIGVQEIIPLLCDRTEKDKFRPDRMKNILVSAMLQSQQCWMPRLLEPISFQKIIEQKGSGKKTCGPLLTRTKSSTLISRSSCIVHNSYWTRR
jgi:16S rRNA (uracil1498-N3)-methyltransferase